MALLTVAFGAGLIVIGILGFVTTGSVHPTALIPVWFGLVLALCGWLSNTENSRRRMLWMHIAVTIGLIGFLFPGFMVLKDWMSAHGAPLAHPAAAKEQAAMAVVCLLFTLLCVRSFIAARRARAA